MIALLGLALAGYPHQPDLIATGTARVAVMSCPHVGQDLVRQGQPPRESLRLGLEAALAAGVDAVALIGDVGGSQCFGGRDPVTDEPIRSCVGDVGPPGTIPKDVEAVEVMRQIEASGFPADRIWYAAGNHDGQSEWLTLAGIDSLTRRGVKAGAPGTTHDSYYARVRLECPEPLTDAVVDWLLLGDRSRSQDYAACGQLVDPATELRKAGMPAGAYDLDQLDFLRSRIVRSAELGVPLVVGAHHVPPQTTYGSWEGEGRAPLYCQGTPLHGPVPAIVQDGRPGFEWPHPLDGLTSRERCDDWSGTAAFLGEDPIPHPSWLPALLGQVEVETGAVDALRLWVGGHSHLPHPDYQSGGHGMDATVQPDGTGQPVQVVQAGGLTRWHSGFGASQFVVVEWDCVGGYQVERWAVDDWAGATCGDQSVRPSTYPGPYDLAPLVGAW